MKLLSVAKRLTVIGLVAISLSAFADVVKLAGPEDGVQGPRVGGISVSLDGNLIWWGDIISGILGYQTQIPADTGSWSLQHYLCAELTQDTPGSTEYYERSVLVGRVGDLVNQMSLLMGNEPAAGLGLAVWEVIYDGEANLGDFSAGRFVVNSAPGNVLTYANNFLSSSFGKSASYYYYANDQLQDFVNPVPEPASLLALLAGLPFIIRRKK